ncbi:MAG TPA: radical SAM protein [Anaerolineae bacterium]|nr:radical SAM protein [Anaerolineae bacterium]
MRVLLVQPPVAKRVVGFSKFGCPEPLALEILAASLADHDVRILDMRLDPQLDDLIRDFAPQVVGVTGYTPNVPQMLAVCSRVKELDAKIVTVVGGYHATLCPEDFDTTDVDVIVVGEGESTFPALLTALEGSSDLEEVAGLVFRRGEEQVATEPRQLLADLDESPLPARHLTDAYRENYFFQFWSSPSPVETARGCPYKCKFCSVWVFHRSRCRFKSPERVLRELERVRSDVAYFVDDNFLQNLRRADRIHQLVTEAGIKLKYWMQARSDSIVKRPDVVERWAQIGLSTVLVGFEKFREDELADLEKRSSVKTNEEAARILRANGVDIWGAFIVDPTWRKSDFDALIDYVRHLKVSFCQFSVLTPLPGTEFFREKLSELTTGNYELFDFLHSVLPTRLPTRQFYGEMARLYSSTTMSFSELKHRLRSGRIQASGLRRIKNLLSEVSNPEAYLRGLDGYGENG